MKLQFYHEGLTEKFERFTLFGVVHLAQLTLELIIFYKVRVYFATQIIDYGKK